MSESIKKSESDVKTVPETTPKDINDKSDKKDPHENGSCCGVCGG